jgi:hypothetical protein
MGLYRGLSDPLSALVDSLGYWVFGLAFDDCAGYTLVLDAIGPDFGYAQLEQPACSAQPAQVMQLQALKLLYLPLVILP